MVVKAALLLSLAGCSVPALSLDGKPCPCTTGYQCNTATNKCVSTISDGPGGAGCLGSSPTGAPIYTFGSFSNWTSGAGAWTDNNGVIVQSDAAAGLAFASTTAVPGPTYRIIATMTGTAGGTALGIAFRVTGMGAQQYACLFSPANGTGASLALDAFTKQGTLSGGMPLAQQPVTSTGATSQYKMEVLAMGGALACCVDGVAGASIAVNDSTYGSGLVGLVTANMTASFQSFVVYGN